MCVSKFEIKGYHEIVCACVSVMKMCVCVSVCVCVREGGGRNRGGGSRRESRPGVSHCSRRVPYRTHTRTHTETQR